MKTERDVRYRQEKEFTTLRIDYDELEQQLEEISNARDREVEVNKRYIINERESHYLGFFSL
jgi:hypothetical protein